MRGRSERIATILCDMFTSDQAQEAEGEGAYRVTSMPVESDRGEGTMAQMKERLAHFETEEGRRKVREYIFCFAPWHASARPCLMRPGRYP